jgi:hypothetical protein
MLHGKIRLINETSSTAYALRLEYLRYPIEIFYDENNPQDYPLGGSINCEFGSQQKKEIIEVAVRTYLERVKDPRWQSFLQEEMLRKASI